jgi:hypothetical protein
MDCGPAPSAVQAMRGAVLRLTVIAHGGRSAALGRPTLCERRREKARAARCGPEGARRRSPVRNDEHERPHLTSSPHPHRSLGRRTVQSVLLLQQCPSAPHRTWY